MSVKVETQNEIIFGSSDPNVSRVLSKKDDKQNNFFIIFAMKKLFAAVCALLLAFTASAQQPDKNLLITMPVPPSSMTTLQSRSSYIIDKYWDTFNPKSSFSSLGRLDYTLEQFFSIAPYASADTVYASIGKLVDKVNKAKPDNLVVLARIAEGKIAADTSEYISEEIYLPFVEAVATNKKVKSPEKARYVSQYQQLKNSMVGRQIADFEFTRPDGTKGHISDVKANNIILFFYDPDCSDCRLAKARLAADIAVPTYINAGALAVVAIYPGEPDAAFKDGAKDLPENWVVGAYPDADRYFTMRTQPQFYYLDNTDGRRKVSAKDIPVDNILMAFNEILKKVMEGANSNAAAEPAQAETPNTPAQ